MEYNLYTKMQREAMFITIGLFRLKSTYLG